MFGSGARVNGFGGIGPLVCGMMILAPARASAEDLVLPYACTVSGNAVHVSPSNDNTYRIVGRRDERPFVACAKSASACETMMVHRFSVECGGVTVPWTQIAQAASERGVPLPANLPEGFAPVSTLSGRFVLPALTRAPGYVAPRVATQDLSPDSVIEAPIERSEKSDRPWVTEVRADVLRAAPSSAAGRLAASLVAVFLMLLAASMIAAGRWRLPSFQLASSPFAAGLFAGRFGRTFQRGMAGLRQARSSIAQAWQRSAARAPSDDLANAALMLNARLIEVELSVASLPTHLLLRDVLYSEIDAIRGRITELERLMTRRAPQKSASAVRALIRELDRISRIAHSAGQEPADTAQEHPAAASMPQSIGEAYRILGINPDAAPQIAKKLVDALRMSWHPDHARDEPDRLRREERMKQINAAWDMIKSQRVAA